MSLDQLKVKLMQALDEIDTFKRSSEVLIADLVS